MQVQESEAPTSASDEEGRLQARDGWQLPLVVGFALLLALVQLASWIAPRPAHAWLDGAPWVHPLLEMTTIVCFAIVFVVGWNAHGATRPARPTVLAIAMLSAGWLDLLHVLTMPGTAVFEVPHLPAETLWLWLFGRCFGLGGLLIVSLMQPGRTIGAPAARSLLAIALVIAAVLSAIGVYGAGSLPLLYVPETGLTALKIGAEFGLAALGLFAAARFWWARRTAQGPFARIAASTSSGLFAASAVLAMSELFFVGYVHFGDPVIVVGHVYKLVGGLILYRLMLASGIRVPFAALSRSARVVQYRERQLQAIIDSAISAIITVDADFRIRVFNRAAEQVFGCRAADVLGKPLDRFIPKTARAQHEGWMRAFGASGEANREVGTAGRHGGADGSANSNTNSLTRIVTALRADESEFPAQASISHVTLEGAHLYTVILRDASAEFEADRALRESHEDLRALSARLQHVREDERGHLARELHDDLGQMLAAMRMDIAALRVELAQAQALPQDARAPVKSMVSDLLASLERISAAAVRSSRRLIADLRPPVVEELGLGEALQRLASEVDGRGTMRCRFEITGECGALQPEQSLALYRIAQESLSNSVRHARARNAILRLVCGADRVQLTVIDDGQGFQAGGRRRKDAFGLIGMRERVHALGGRFDIQTEPGGGTRIEADIPCEHGKAAFN